MTLNSICILVHTVVYKFQSERGVCMHSLAPCLYVSLVCVYVRINFACGCVERYTYPATVDIGFLSACAYYKISKKLCTKISVQNWPCPRMWIGKDRRWTTLCVHAQYRCHDWEGSLQNGDQEEDRSFCLMQISRTLHFIRSWLCRWLVCLLPNSKSRKNVCA